MAASMVTACDLSSRAGGNPNPGAASPSVGGPSSGSPGAAAGADLPSPAAGVCRNPREHVYHPDRLEVRNPCMSVTGKIREIHAEPDGDFHVRLQLDPPFANLINDRNTSGQHGDLLLEPVCEQPVTQPDAITTCIGVQPSVKVPPVGTHVTATGAYVLDHTHGWMELHPLWEIHQS
jgi:hypothetical protein